MASPAGPGRRLAREQFRRYWHLDRCWVEPPNLRRGGYSGVLRQRAEPASTSCGTEPYIKLQSNSTYRDPRAFGRRLPTLRREQRQLMRAARAGVRVPRPVFYGERGRDAVLVLMPIERAQPLDTALEALRGDPLRRFRLIQALTEQLRRLHGARLQHGALYPKHILVTWSTQRPLPEVCLIDFEKARRRRSRRLAAAHDLERLFRRCAALTPSDRDRILDSYRPVLGERWCRRLLDSRAGGHKNPAGPAHDV